MKKLSFLCSNCQILANFNTFEIIFGGKLGTRQYFPGNIWGRANAHMPPVALPLKGTVINLLKNEVRLQLTTKLTHTYVYDS